MSSMASIDVTYCQNAYRDGIQSRPLMKELQLKHQEPD